MRVLLVAGNVLVPDTHGGSTHVCEVVRNLRRRHEVLLVARRGARGPDTLGVGLVAPPPFKHMAALSAVPLCLGEVRRFAPEVVYERCSSYGLGAAIATLLRLPLVCMFLDEHYSLLSLSRADCIITTRPEIVPRHFRSKARAVHWGANAEVFHPGVSGEGVRERLGLMGKRVVGYAGSFRPWHGLDDLISCAARLTGEDVVFLLVGDGSERRDLEQKIAALGLKDRFRLTGRVSYDSVPEYLAAADICVAPFRPDRHGPSRKHGMVLDPLKVFEYLALKKAVITIHSRNMERLFKDGEELLMVEPGDVAALTSGVRDLCCDSGKAERLAAAGHAAVLERYTWQSHVEALEGIFRELLGRSQ